MLVLLMMAVMLMYVMTQGVGHDDGADGNGDDGWWMMPDGLLLRMEDCGGVDGNGDGHVVHDGGRTGDRMRL